MQEKILTSTGHTNPARVAEGKFWQLWQATLSHPTHSAQYNFIYIKRAAAEGSIHDAAKALGSRRANIVLFADKEIKESARTAINNCEPFLGATIYSVRDFLFEVISRPTSAHAKIDREKYYVDPTIRFADDNRETGEAALIGLERWLQGANRHQDDWQERNVAVALGPAGTGKSAIATELFHRIAARRTRKFVPLLVDKHSWERFRINRQQSGTPSLDEIWDNALKACYPSAYVSHDLLSQALAHGAILPIFDGLDELCSVLPIDFNPTETLRQVLDLFPPNAGGRLLLTSRTSFWGANIEPDLQSRILQIHVQPFSGPQRRAYLQGRFPNDSVSQQQANAILSSISMATPKPSPQGEGVVGTGAYDQIGYVPWVVAVVASSVEGRQPFAEKKLPEQIRISDPIGSIIELYCSRDFGKGGIPAKTQKQALEYLACEHGEFFSTAEIRDAIALFGDHSHVAPMTFQALIESLDGGRSRFAFNGVLEYLQASVLSRWLALGQRNTSDEMVKWGPRVLERCADQPGSLLDACSQLIRSVSGVNWVEEARARWLGETLDFEQKAGFFSLVMWLARDYHSGSNREVTETVRSVFCDNENDCLSMSNLALKGSIQKIVFAGVVIRRSVLENVEFVHCAFDPNTVLDECEIRGDFRVDYCKGFGCVIRQGGSLSDEARDVFHREEYLAGKIDAMTVETIEAVIRYVLGRLKKRNSFIDVAEEGLRSWAQQKSALIGDTVVSELMKIGIIVAVDGGRDRCAVDSSNEVRSFLDQEISSKRIRQCISDLEQKFAR